MWGEMGHGTHFSRRLGVKSASQCGAQVDRELGAGQIGAPVRMWRPGACVWAPQVARSWALPGLTS